MPSIQTPNASFTPQNLGTRHQKTKCFFVKGSVVAGGASHSTPSALTSYVSGSTETAYQLNIDTRS